MAWKFRKWKIKWNAGEKKFKKKNEVYVIYADKCTISDRELDRLNIVFKKIKSGDLKAFNQLFNSLYPSMCSAADSFIRDQDKSRDIAQEAFINLWNKRDDYDSITSLKTFLYVSVKNLCLN